MTSKSGFSFLELIVAVAIMAILATVVGVKVLPHLGKSKITAAKTQIDNIETALKLYKMDTSMFPTQAQGLEALIAVPTQPPVPKKYTPGGYLDKNVLPLDPWGQPYIYLIPGPDGADYEIMTYGADGEPGGTGENADISSLEP